MKTLGEKISFILTALAYVLFHLGKMPDTGSVVVGTTTALLNTLPFEIGFTYLIVAFIRRTTGGQWPPWDRILRIFFTVGIIFGLIYNLYVRGAVEQQEQEQDATVTRSWKDDSRKEPSYWA
jgi:hypothetical protein